MHDKIFDAILDENPAALKEAMFAVLYTKLRESIETEKLTNANQLFNLLSDEEEVVEEEVVKEDNDQLEEGEMPPWLDKDKKSKKKKKGDDEDCDDDEEKKEEVDVDNNDGDIEEGPIDWYQGKKASRAARYMAKHRARKRRQAKDKD